MVSEVGERKICSTLISRVWQLSRIANYKGSGNISLGGKEGGEMVEWQEKWSLESKKGTWEHKSWSSKL